MRCMALAILLVLLFPVPLAACGSGKSPSSAPAGPNGQSSVEAMPSTATPSPPGAPAAGAQIVIFNMAYTVPPSVSPGQELTIVNKDEPNHTVTADENNLFDVRVSGGGGIMSFTAPTTPGTYPFHCKYHANMHGVLTVQ